MAQSDAAAAYLERMNPGARGSLAATDPEFAERYNTFAFDEVVNEEAAKLPHRERFLAILAALMDSILIQAPENFLHFCGFHLPLPFQLQVQSPR